MSENIMIWLYGTRAARVNTRKKSKKVTRRAAPSKSLVRIPLDEIRRAKAFHVFFRQDENSPWVRLTPELEVIPSIVRSNQDKLLYIETFVEFNTAPFVEEEPEVEPVEEKPVIKLPELPKEPRVSITKKQFGPIMARIIFDELDGMGIKWPKARINNLIEKAWRGYSHAPHLLADESFRRRFATKEITERQRRKKKRLEAKRQEEFRKELQNKDVSLDPDIVGGITEIKFKEVFNKRGQEDENEMTRVIRPDGVKEVEVDRQMLFTQVSTEYNEMIQVSADDTQDGQEMLKMAVDKVRDDVGKIFNEAFEKGVFKESSDAVYSIRLITPMINVQGEVPQTYTNRKGEITSGYGISTVRHKVSNEDDLDALIEDLFADLPKILSRYVAINGAAGIGFTGFVIERLIR